VSFRAALAERGGRIGGWRQSLIQSERAMIGNSMRENHGERRQPLAIIIGRPAVGDAALSARDQCVRLGDWPAGAR